MVGYSLSWSGSRPRGRYGYGSWSFSGSWSRSGSRYWPGSVSWSGGI